MIFDFKISLFHDYHNFSFKLDCSLYILFHTRYYFTLKMKRSMPILRGAKGYSWYNQFVKEGKQGFEVALGPTPFDWGVIERPRAYFTMKIDNDAIGDLVFELASDVVPTTVENFKRLCNGDGIKFPGYAGTKFHLVRKGEVIMGGDVERGDGLTSHSSYDSRYFRDENYIIPHTQRGLISMVSTGVHTNGSQFYISLNPAKHLNGRSVAFGRLVDGDNTLKAIENVFTFRGAPARKVMIEKCGMIRS